MSGHHGCGARCGPCAHSRALGKRHLNCVQFLSLSHRTLILGDATPSAPDARMLRGNPTRLCLTDEPDELQNLRVLVCRSTVELLWVAELATEVVPPAQPLSVPKRGRHRRHECAGRTPKKYMCADFFFAFRRDGVEGDDYTTLWECENRRDAVRPSQSSRIPGSQISPKNPRQNQISPRRRHSRGQRPRDTRTMQAISAERLSARAASRGAAVAAKSIPRAALPRRAVSVVAQGAAAPVKFSTANSEKVEWLQSPVVSRQRDARHTEALALSS